MAVRKAKTTRKRQVGWNRAKTWDDWYNQSIAVGKSLPKSYWTWKKRQAKKK